ncbi:hypothetical protein [Bacillus sp. Marseille-P3661]|uniref:hypothetical protein n=1 Tax=Bacillus sp. Marseille-P3661 TaxID=1936234 RepID=UPI000C839A98|nr:hypothetical protein [Bacillus sp. Marseille-P3661]
MKTRLGIVGPEDSVKLILDVADEFSDIINIPFVYKRFEESREIVNKAKDEVDVWLFSGQAPYAFAEEYLINQNGFYPPLNGSSLSKVLLDISYKDKKSLNKLSIDTIPQNEVLETFTELGLNTGELQLLPYKGYKPKDELVDFHYQLYKKGIVESCITYIRSVYETLNNMNVPVYRIKPTRMVIRETISIASQKSEMLHFKSSQISVLILQIYDMNNLIGENSVSFDAYRLNLKLQDIIIEFTESISGSFIQLGNDKFIIFSTRGALESQNNNEIFTLLEKVILITTLTANIGIGYGKTVFGAEQNAYLALNHAKNNGKNIAMLANENGVIEGPLQKQNSLSFSYRSEDLELIEKLKNAGVNISTFNKILSIQDNLGQGSINSTNLAKWLDMTQRNARRILSDLEKHNLAKIVGIETSSTRGRPSKIYRVEYIKK